MRAPQLPIVGSEQGKPQSRKRKRGVVVLESWMEKALSNPTRRSGKIWYICPGEPGGKRCGKGFGKRSNLLNHFPVHVASLRREKVCYTCNLPALSKARKSISSLSARSDSDQQSPILMRVCGKKFRNKAKYRRHLRVHRGERPFACQVCNVDFARKDHLRRHMAIHTGERPHQCTEPGCGKRFRLPQHLHEHQAVHERKWARGVGAKSDNASEHNLNGGSAGSSSTVKGPSASTRGGTWKRKRTLSFDTGYPVFRRQQTPEDTFCHFCGLRLRVASLRSHLETHSSKRALFPCPGEGCNKVYNTRSNLSEHRRSVHEGRVFQCSVPGCRKIYRYNVTLKRHLARDHADADRELVGEPPVAVHSSPRAPPSSSQEPLLAFV